MKSKKIFFVIFIILVIIILFASNYKYNRQINISTFDKLYIYKFEESKGFNQYKVDNQQKKAIWNLIENMTPNKNKISQDDYIKTGGYAAFYFKKDSIKNVFYLKDKGNDELYIELDIYDKNNKIINTLYFTSSTQLAKKIKDVIFIPN